MASNLKVHMLRLIPGQELKDSLEGYVRHNAPRGVFVMTCCGSVTSATLRLAANANGETNKIKTYNQHFEVLSLSGTLSKGGTHLHICLSDNDGNTVGGHVMGGLRVFTTMEVALGEPLDLTLDRDFDASTGFSELIFTKDAEGSASQDLAEGGASDQQKEGSTS